jgi:small subunit ribosomal protein S17
VSEQVGGRSAAPSRGDRKTRVGRVISNKMNQTVVVQVERMARHSLYSKTVRRRRKLYAHDAENTCRIGDTVRIVETRPMSKLKRWRVVDVVERSRE